MTIYKPKVEDPKTKSTSKQETNSYVEDADDDNPLVSSDTAYIVQQPHTPRRRNVTVIRCFIIFTTFFLSLLVVFGATIYLYKHAMGDQNKPWIELCRVRYHEWKTGASGSDKSFLMEGEFYQQVEIDVNQDRYEKLNIPPVLNTRRASILHDMDVGLTAIIDQDHGRCFITQINATLVKPISDYYELVKYNKAGYYLPDAELIRDNYRLLKPAIEDVSQFGQRIYSYCEFYDTYRLVRDDPPLDKSETTACYFEGEQYCLGNAGSKYMLVLAISRCVGSS